MIDDGLMVLCSGLFDGAVTVQVQVLAGQGH